MKPKPTANITRANTIALQTNTCMANTPIRPFMNGVLLENRFKFIRLLFIITEQIWDMFIKWKSS